MQQQLRRGMTAKHMKRGLSPAHQIDVPAKADGKKERRRRRRRRKCSWSESKENGRTDRQTDDREKEREREGKRKITEKMRRASERGMIRHAQQRQSSSNAFAAQLTAQHVAFKWGNVSRAHRQVIFFPFPLGAQRTWRETKRFVFNFLYISMFPCCCCCCCFQRPGSFSLSLHCNAHHLQ